jgi:uncharacterized membrane protein YhaH (DUF805 family)
MKNLLFNPNGRIAKTRFWQGLVILTVAAIIKRGIEVKLPDLMTGPLSLLTMLATLVLVYVNICVYAKRFHDAGTSGAWIIAVWLGKFFVFMLLFALFGGLFLGEEGLALSEAIMESFTTSDEGLLSQAMQRFADLVFPLFVFSYVANAVIFGFVVGRLGTEPRTNQHGPVPLSTADNDD